jgi:membrane associated rhomboid family serine protease
MALIVGINDVNSFLTWIILDTIWTMQCRPGVGWAGHLGGACFGFASAQVVRAFFL